MTWPTPYDGHTLWEPRRIQPQLTFGIWFSRSVGMLRGATLGWICILRAFFYFFFLFVCEIDPQLWRSKTPQKAAKTLANRKVVIGLKENIFVTKIRGGLASVVLWGYGESWRHVMVYSSLNNFFFLTTLLGRICLSKYIPMRWKNLPLYSNLLSYACLSTLLQKVNTTDRWRERERNF